MNRFSLIRIDDVSGVSGVGHVADGVRFSDGTTVIRWVTEKRSTSIYDSVDDMIDIHGHNGSTRIVWHDPLVFGGNRPEELVA